MTTTRLWKHKY